MLASRGDVSNSDPWLTPRPIPDINAAYSCYADRLFAVFPQVFLTPGVGPAGSSLRHAPCMPLLRLASAIEGLKWG